MANHTLPGNPTGESPDLTHSPSRGHARLPRLLFAAGVLLAGCTPGLSGSSLPSAPQPDPMVGLHQALAVPAGGPQAALFEAPAPGIDTPAAARIEPPARPTWHPPNLGTHPYQPQIERWRPRVQELLAEAYDQGRLQGKASILDDDLVLAVIARESNGNPRALSHAGAKGLMQLMPPTYAEMMDIPQSRIRDIDPDAYWDVDSNLRAGIRYLDYVLNDQNGNLYWALAAYNGGTTITRRWRVSGLDAVPPTGRYLETAEYAQIVLRNYLSRRPDVQVYVPSPMPAAHVPGALVLLAQVPVA